MIQATIEQAWKGLQDTWHVLVIREGRGLTCFWRKTGCRAVLVVVSSNRWWFGLQVVNGEDGLSQECFTFSNLALPLMKAWMEQWRKGTSSTILMVEMNSICCLGEERITGFLGALMICPIRAKMQKCKKEENVYFLCGRLPSRVGNAENEV